MPDMIRIPRLSSPLSDMRIGALRALAALAAMTLSAPAGIAMVGGARNAEPTLSRHVVLIIGSRGTSCTATAIARDLLLTAAHCALPGADYKWVEFDAKRQPTLRDIASVVRHPGFDLNTMLAHRATADVALMKLAAPLPASYAAAPLAASRAVAPGDTLTVAGYGLSVRGDGRSGGVIRVADLAVTGQPGTLQIRLYDPATRGDTPGLGACTGDSGAPLFDMSAGRPQILGVVSWSTGPKLSDGCGGLTGVTPLTRYKDWIVQQAAKMGSALE